MDRALLKVVAAYLVCLTVACIYVPWEAQPVIPAVVGDSLTYDFFWTPPHTYGYRHVLARDRLFLEIASLTAVLALAGWQLERREKGANPARRNG